MNAPEPGDRDATRPGPTRAPATPRATASVSLQADVDRPLPDSNERLSLAFRTLGDGLIVQDAQGTIYECNAAAEAIIGLTRDQMMGRTSMDPLWRAVYPDGRAFPGELHPATVALRTGQSVRGVEMGIDATGRGRRWISINAEPLRNSADAVVLVAVTFADITARKEAESALRASELRFRAYAEQATDAVFVHDFSGRLSYANQQACTSLGYTREELLTMSVVDLETQFDLPRAQSAWRQIEPGFPFRLEGIHRRKDGTTFPVEVQFGCFDSDGSRHYVGHVRDISDRKKVEVALVESEARFAAFMDALPGLAFIKTADGRHLFANRALCQTLGIATTGWQGKTTAELAGGIDISAINADDARLVATRQVLLVEQTLQLPTRTATFLTSKFPLKSDPAAPLFGGIAIDITARKQAENDLHTLHDRLRRIGDNLPNGYIYQVERAVGKSARFTFISAGALSVHGVSPEEVLRDPCVLATQVIEDDHAAWAAAEEASYRNLTDFAVELRYLAPGGGVRWLQLKSTPQRKEVGTVVWDGIALDITDQKRVEADHLIRSKLAATGLLAGGLAHDYNNLLQVLLLHLDAAKNSGRSPAELRDCLDAATQAVNSARDLTKQLITFAAGGAPVRHVLNLGPLLRDAFASALRGSNVAGTCDLAPDLWWSAADRGQLEHVITQLVFNARDAVPRGGLVALQVENWVAAVPANPALPPGDYLHVSVADQGPGIADDVLPKIFDPYFSTKPRGAQKGMGLGLTTCRSIVERHGGTITVDTVLGRGTTVHFYVPATRREATAADSLPPATHAATRSGKILVMDDDDSLRSVLRLTLEIMGYTATAAAHGDEAITQYRDAQTQGCPYDLALLDLTVPHGMGGIATFAELRRLDPAARAVVMSGYSDSSSLQNWNEAGFSGALAKPFDSTTLTQVLTQALAHQP